MALGLIETVGMAAAIEAADAAVKSANVDIIGYELTKGSGLVVVKFSGDVGAVNVAVEIGKEAAMKISEVYSWKVIPRPHESLEKFMTAVDKKMEKEKLEETNLEEIKLEEIDLKEIDLKEIKLEETKPQETKPQETKQKTEKEEVEKIQETMEAKSATCNLCNDPKCTRKKGEPKINCIYEQ